MTLILRQSTSIDIRMGPFVDATDAVTPETGVTLAGADQAEVLKANGAATVTMAGTFAAVTGADGWYDYTVAAGDVDTVGEVVFVVQDASVCLPVFTRAYVVEEAVYDAMYAATAAGPLQSTTAGRTLDVAATGEAGVDFGNVTGTLTNANLAFVDANERVDVGEWLGTAVNASTAGYPDINVYALDNNAAIPPIMSRWYGNGHVRGTSDSGTTSTMTDAALTLTNDEALVGRRIVFTSGTNNGVEVLVTAFNNATDTVTFTPTLSNAVTTENYILFPGGEVNTRTISAGAVDSFWDETMTETTGAPAVTGTFRAALEWIFALSRNKITQTSTTTTLRDDTDTTDLATSTVSDNGTTYTRGEWST